MRQLRKTNMEYEERNAALQKHVESMRGAVERLEGDVMQERGRNGLLHQHLETLRQALASSFSTVPLPGGYSKLHQGQLFLWIDPHSYNWTKKFHVISN